MGFRYLNHGMIEKGTAYYHIREHILPYKERYIGVTGKTYWSNRKDILE